MQQLEINEKFGRETAELLKGFGYHSIEIVKDMDSKDRMIKARR